VVTSGTSQLVCRHIASNPQRNFTPRASKLRSRPIAAISVSQFYCSAAKSLQVLPAGCQTSSYGLSVQTMDRKRLR